jgi:hypothetical protein
MLNNEGSKDKGQEMEGDIVKIEVSNGELVDKVSILSIKLQKVTSKKKLANIQKEYEILVQSLQEINISIQDKDFKELVKINQDLWTIEDRIRKKEARKEFDETFIELARSVYHKNDQRSAVKRRINLNTNSLLIEEKEYVDYA